MTQRKVAQSLVRRPLLAAVLAASAVAPAPAMAAADYFLKIEGVPGESLDVQHKGEIDIASFSWGMSNPATRSGGGGAGKVTLCEFAIVKHIDIASPLLFQALGTGKHYDTATITARKAGSSQDYYKLKLNDVLVSSMQDSGASGDAATPTQMISLNFSNIEYSYTLQNADGAPVGAPVVATANCRVQPPDR